MTITPLLLLLLLLFFNVWDHLQDNLRSPKLDCIPDSFFFFVLFVGAQFALADDVDISALALKFELTGGLIKNAVQAALCKACARSSADDSTTNDNSNQVMLTHSDLIDGAQLQLRSFLKLKGLETQMVPSVGLDDVILNDPLKEKLHQIVNHEKARAILYGQWGFGKKHGNARGLCAMFAGIPGSGIVCMCVHICTCNSLDKDAAFNSLFDFGKTNRQNPGRRSDRLRAGQARKVGELRRNSEQVGR